MQCVIVAVDHIWFLWNTVDFIVIKWQISSANKQEKNTLQFSMIENGKCKEYDNVQNHTLLISW